jgi:hypothetical protein
VIERPVELVDRQGTESVAHLRPVEGDPNGALGNRPVIGDVLELETFYGPPRVRIEDL